MKNQIQVSGTSVLIFRVALSGIFLFAGINHLLKPDKVVARIKSAAFNEFGLFFGDPHLMAILTGYLLLLGGSLLLLGVFQRWSALGLLMILIPITITIQMGNGLTHGPLWKNVALFGGLLFFILNNPKAYAVYSKY